MFFYPGIAKLLMLMFPPYISATFTPNMDLIDDIILGNFTVENWGDWYKGLSQPVGEALLEVMNF